MTWLSISGCLLPLSVESGEAQTDRPSAWAVESWIIAGTGYENESTVDPDLNRALVPGGPFLNLTPGARFGRDFGRRTSLAFFTTGSVERFFNDEERLLLGLSGWGDLTFRPYRRLYTRLSLGADYFDDSVIESVTRAGLNGRAALGVGGIRGGAELIVGARGRRYPEIAVETASGGLKTYTETSGSVGAAAYGFLSRRVYLRGEALYRTNEAADPLFDYQSWYLLGGAQFTHGPKWTTWLSAMFQQRDFQERPAIVNQDEYAQFGARGVRWLRGGTQLSISYTFARYVQPAGNVDNTHRVGVFFQYNIGGDRIRHLPAPPLTELRLEYDPLISGQMVRFRLHAPQAAEVAVAGDFNGWSTETHVMSRLEAGWWELAVEISPGHYQYAYVIDGKWTTPPQATETLDDGFGGRNGLFIVREP